MNLSQVIQEIDEAFVTGPQDQPLSSLTYDAKTATTGSLFIAVRRLWVDGHEYIHEAIQNGALAIIAETPRPAKIAKKIGWVQVQSTRGYRAQRTG